MASTGGPTGAGPGGPASWGRRYAAALAARLGSRRGGGSRLTVRLRLALLSAVIAVLGGAVLLGASYALLNPQLYQIGGRLIPPGAGSVPRVVIQYSRAAQPPAACLALLRSPGAAASAAGAAQNAAACLAALPKPPAAPGAGPNDLAFFVSRVSSAQLHLDLRHLLVRGGIALGLLALVALAAGWWVAGRILEPLQVMTRRAQSLSAQMPLGRIRLDGPQDELKALADTFDGLLERLDAALASERMFVANASHELRTPLAIEQTILDVALADPAADAATLRRAAERLRQVNARSRRLIEGLLALARTQAGLWHAEAVDLADVARAAVEAAAQEAAQRGVRVAADFRGAAARGDPALLERLAGNLLENAIRHNVAGEGGWAEVRTWTAGGHALLRVANSGPTIPAGAVPGLFEPFRRGARARTRSHSGAGLGLALVRAVAQAHGGTVTAAARHEGGLEVTVSLPGGGMGER